MRFHQEWLEDPLVCFNLSLKFEILLSTRSASLSSATYIAKRFNESTASIVCRVGRLFAKYAM